MFGNIDDDHPLLRAETLLVQQPGVTTIKYKAGLDFRMSIFESQDFPVRREENPYEILTSWKGWEPESFDKEQKKLFCLFLEKYDGIKQMEKQLLDLGLKSSKILDACKKIISEYNS
ncbi:hypothetical protein AWY79_07815 [Pseudodesulfovibrio indicus]|uniref:Uncharacterized protein n=1 Tax=Pseudodesulfovibrio indicus TaxID=1716143 RepID=A0ABM5YU33_9BACT|nr:hypothetical protein AWY79_07815 [Pseudodesulfovibrio indicus]